MRNSVGAVPSCRYVSFAEVLKGKAKARHRGQGSGMERTVRGEGVDWEMGDLMVVRSPRQKINVDASAC